ncbi:hypothetical protein KJ780_05275 [Candidatus Micrarchaeota archaeon]|nr:hypothetical protein [Candidatus Micrarchaeota archaeon]
MPYTFNDTMNDARKIAKWLDLNAGKIKEGRARLMVNIKVDEKTARSQKNFFSSDCFNQRELEWITENKEKVKEALVKICGTKGWGTGSAGFERMLKWIKDEASKDIPSRVPERSGGAPISLAPIIPLATMQAIAETSRSDGGALNTSTVRTELAEKRTRKINDYERAAELEDNGKYAEAAVIYSKICKRQPNNLLAFEKRAMFELRRRQIDMALTHLTMAIDIGERLQKAEDSRPLLGSAKERPRYSSWKEYRMNPDRKAPYRGASAETYATRAVIWAKKGEYKKASDDMKHALELCEISDPRREKWVEMADTLTKYFAKLGMRPKKPKFGMGLGNPEKEIKSWDWDEAIA